MNYKDFYIETQIDLYDLQVDDYFMEDTYPEVFRIDDIIVEDMGLGGKENLQTVYKTYNVTKEETCNWFYDKSYPAYAPCLFRLKIK